MKKIYLFFALLMSLTSIGQPIITMIADGDESGGTPAVLEIYAKGTVDFSQYSLQNQANANTTWGNDFDLSPLGTVTDGFVYVYSNKNSSTDAFAVNFPSVTTNKLDATSSSVLNINGDDRVRIVETTNTTPVDTYGEDGVDGTGKPWEYKDGYAKRINGTGPDPVFVQANWEFHNGDLNNHGAAQDGTTYESIIGIGTYTPASVSNPSLAITAPTNNQVFAPNVTDVEVQFVVQNFSVAQTGGDGHIDWRLDNGSWTHKYDTNPIQITGLSAGSHTVDMKLVDDSDNDLNPPVEASVTFSIATYTQVATLAALRAGTVGDYYHYTGEAFATAGILYNSGNLKGYAQDHTAGIMAYIPAGTTTHVINEGDGITDVKGKLVDFHGVLEIEVTEDFTLTGHNVPQTPQVVSIPDYKANHDDYESELIKFENVTIDPSGDTEFQANKNYDVTDGTDTTILRTSFPPLVGESIPTTTVNVIGIGAEYNGTAQILPRDINDIEVAAAIGKNNIDGLNIYPNPVNNGTIYITSDTPVSKKVTIYNITGKQVFSKEVENGEAISIRNLKTGIYLVKVIENDKVAVQKLMVK